MSTAIYMRAAKITGNNSCALLMLIGQQHKDTFYDIMMKTSYPTLREYYFMFMWENLEGREFDTGMYRKIKSIELGEAIQYKNETLYPIRADLEISLGDYYRLRSAYKDRINSFPSFTELDG